MSSIPAAQGIAGRLLHIDSSMESGYETITMEWLRSAAKSGSLTAVEDLEKRHPEYCQEAKQVFRASGGFNDALDNIEALNTLKCMGLRKNREHTETQEQAKTIENPVDSSGNTLLHYAATYGELELVSDLMVESPASIDLQNYNGESALYKACLSGHTAVVRSLVASGANPALPSEPFGITCLHWLFNFEDQDIEDVATLLISTSAADINARIRPIAMNHGYTPIVSEHFPFHRPLGTPLHWAVSAHSAKAVNVLLALGADIDALDLPEGDNGQSALVMAIYRNDADMVELLLSKGARADWTDKNGRNLVHMMVSNFPMRSREFDLPRCVWSWVNHGSCQNQVAQLKRCLAAVQAHGVQINMRADKFETHLLSQTPLLDAVDSRDVCAIIALIDAGADCNLKSGTGDLPVLGWLNKDSRCLDHPVLYPVALRKLLQGVRDVDTRNDLTQRSIWHHAATTNGTDHQLRETIDILHSLDTPPDIDAQDRYGATPLLGVIEDYRITRVLDDVRNTPARVEIIIQAGADIEMRNYLNEDFLYYLCKNPRLSDDETLGITTMIMARFSPAKQAKIVRDSYTTRRQSGKTALMEAVDASKLRVVKYLVSLEVDINKVDNEERTALDWALGRAERNRQRFIYDLEYEFGVAERQDALDDGTAFTSTLHLGTNTLRDGSAKRAQYFNSSAIINFLESSGAQQWSSPTSNASVNRNPLLEDIRVGKLVFGKYIPSKQPHLKQWTRLYEIAWDEHRELSHSNCPCCNLLRRLPTALLAQKFTLALLDEISKVQPHFDNIQDLLPES